MRTELKWVDEHAGDKPYGINRVIAQLIFAHKSRLQTARPIVVETARPQDQRSEAWIVDKPRRGGHTSAQGNALRANAAALQPSSP